MIKISALIIFACLGHSIYAQESSQYTIGFGWGERNDIFYVKSDPAGYLLGHPNKYHWREGNDKEKMYTFFFETMMKSKWVFGLDYSQYSFDSFVATYFDRIDFSPLPDDTNDSAYLDFSDYFSSSRWVYDVHHFQFSGGYAFDFWGKRLSVVPSIGLGYALLTGGIDRPNSTNISFGLSDGTSIEPWYARTFYSDMRTTNIYAHFNLQLNVPIYKGIIAFGKIHFIQGVFEEFQEIVSYEEPFRRIDGVDQFVGELSTRGSTYGWLAGIKLNLNWVFPKLNR